MRTQSRSRHKIVEPFRIELPFQEDQFQEDSPEVSMADNRTMAQLLQAPTEGYEDAIVIPEIAATNFELKHGLINLVQNKKFFGHEDPHTHIRYFNKITSTMRIPNVPNSTIKLMLFPFSLEGAAQIWLGKEPPRSILTWDDLVSKFINQGEKIPVNADDLKSQTGYVFVLNSGAVDWKSAKQSIFATSSAEAEYIATFDAFKEAVWVRKFISRLGVFPTVEQHISMYCDNTGAIVIANESGITKGARHFRAKVHYLCEVIEYA
nr:reverse transcriptase domain-containing protein [Tanacetum cinerariifolium]